MSSPLGPGEQPLSAARAGISMAPPMPGVFTGPGPCGLAGLFQLMADQLQHGATLACATAARQAGPPASSRGIFSRSELRLRKLRCLGPGGTRARSDATCSRGHRWPPGPEPIAFFTRDRRTSPSRGRGWCATPSTGELSVRPALPPDLCNNPIGSWAATQDLERLCRRPGRGCWAHTAFSDLRSKLDRLRRARPLRISRCRIPVSFVRNCKLARRRFDSAAYAAAMAPAQRRGRGDLCVQDSSHGGGPWRNLRWSACGLRLGGLAHQPKDLASGPTPKRIQSPRTACSPLPRWPCSRLWTDASPIGGRNAAVGGIHSRPRGWTRRAAFAAAPVCGSRCPRSLAHDMCPAAGRRQSGPALS